MWFESEILNVKRDLIDSFRFNYDQRHITLLLHTIQHQHWNWFMLAGKHVIFNRFCVPLRPIMRIILKASFFNFFVSIFCGYRMSFDAIDLVLLYGESLPRTCFLDCFINCDCLVIIGKSSGFLVICTFEMMGKTWTTFNILIDCASIIRILSPLCHGFPIFISFLWRRGFGSKSHSLAISSLRSWERGRNLL